MSALFLSSRIAALTRRILYVITDSGIGGSEKIIHTLLTRLSPEAASPCGVVVLKERREMGEKWADTGIPVHALGMKKWPSPRVLSGLRRIIREVKPDIVHAFLYHSIQLSRLVHRTDKSFKLVSSPRVNYGFAPKTALIIDSLLRRVDDLVLCESRAGQASLVKLGYSIEKTIVAMNGVDNEIYKFDAASRIRLRKEWEIPENQMLIGSVGRLHPQKGYDILIGALEKLKGGPVPFTTVIVGSGPAEEELKKTAKKNDAPVLFLPNRTDIPAVLSAFDIYVQSSRYEGLSNALLEALSVSRPCVATAVDGTLDFAQDGKNMLLVKPEDPLSLAIGIGHLLEKSALRQALSTNAKITAQSHSATQMVRAFEKAYSKLNS